MGLKGMNINIKSQMKYGNNRFIFDSQKNRMEIIAQSTLEHAGFLSLEIDPFVVRYEPHPGKIHIELSDGQHVRSIFDALVIYTDGRNEYVEFKYESEINGDNDRSFKSRRQIDIQSQWCELNGFEYRVITDKDLFINKPYYYPNMVYMVRSLRPECAGEPQTVLKEKSLNILEKIKWQGGKALIGDLIVNKNNPDEIENVMTNICWLLVNRYIIADLCGKNISFGMEVSVIE